MLIVKKEHIVEAEVKYSKQEEEEHRKDGWPISLIKQNLKGKESGDA